MRVNNCPHFFFATISILIRVKTKGDGGGPLLCQHDDEKYYVHGINSVGAGCANGLPDFFIEVSEEKFSLILFEIYFTSVFLLRFRRIFLTCS